MIILLQYKLYSVAVAQPRFNRGQWLERKSELPLHFKKFQNG